MSREKLTAVVARVGRTVRFPGRVVLKTGAGYEVFVAGGSRDTNLWREAILDGQHAHETLASAKRAAGSIGAYLEKISSGLWAVRYEEAPVETADAK